MSQDLNAGELLSKLHGTPETVSSKIIFTLAYKQKKKKSRLLQNLFLLEVSK